MKRPSAGYRYYKCHGCGAYICECGRHMEERAGKLFHKKPCRVRVHEIKAVLVQAD